MNAEAQINQLRGKYEALSSNKARAQFISQYKVILEKQNLGGNENFVDFLGECLEKYNTKIRADYNIESASIAELEQLANGDGEAIAQAQHELGIRYEEGERGASKDIAIAVKWYEMAEKLNYAPAIHYLACCYKWGKCKETNVTEALKLLNRAAAQGYNSSFYLLGLHYLPESISTAELEDLAKSMNLLERAGRLGCAEALFSIMNICQYPSCNDSKKYIEALEKYANHHEDGFGRVLLGLVYCNADYTLWTPTFASELYSHVTIPDKDRLNKGLELIQQGENKNISKYRFFWNRCSRVLRHLQYILHYVREGKRISPSFNKS